MQHHLAAILVAFTIICPSQSYAQHGWTLRADSAALFPRSPSISCSDPNNCTAVGNRLDGDYYPSILRSTDGGRTWGRQEVGSDISESPTSGGYGMNVHLYGVAMLDSARVVAVGGGGRIFRTSDAGTTWIREDSLTPYPLTTLSFCDASHGVAASSATSHGFVYATTDGGESWRQIATGTTGFRRIVCISPNSFLGVLTNMKDRYALTTDGGETWSEHRFPLSVGSETSWPGGFSFIDESHGWTAGSFIDGDAIRDVVMSTSDGGLTWSVQRSDSGSSYGLLAPIFSDPMNGMAIGRRGAVLATDDGGASWRLAEPEPTAIIGQHTIGSVSSTGTTLFALTMTGRFMAYRTMTTSAAPPNEIISPSPLPYPNPARDRLTLHVGGKRSDLPSQVTIVLHDSRGSRVATIDANVSNDGSVHIDVGSLPPGAYRASEIGNRMQGITFVIGQR